MNVVEAEPCPWDYQSFLSCNGNEVTVSFYPMPMPEVQEEILSQSVSQVSNGDSKDQLVQRKVVRSPSLDLDPTSMILILIFVKSSKDFLFPLILEKLKCLKSKKFLKLIYESQVVFSLCDEDLGLCDCIKHTIPTTTDKPVYLPHRTIPFQLQAKV